jgi:hypothetical protein
MRIAIWLSCLCLLLVLGSGAALAQDEPASAQPAEDWQPQVELERLVQATPPLQLKRLWQVKPVGFNAAGIAISADGQRLLTFGSQHCHFWDAQTGRIVGRLRQDPGSQIKCGALSEHGDFAIIGLKSGGAIVLADTGEIVFRHTAPQGAVTDVAISRDGEWVAIGESQNVFHRYPLRGGQGNTIRVLDSPPRRADECGAISPSGRAWLHTNRETKDAVSVNFVGEGKVGFKLSGFPDARTVAVTDRFAAGIEFNGRIVLANNNATTAFPLVFAPFRACQAALADNEEELRSVTHNGWLDFRLLRYPKFPMLAKFNRDQESFVSEAAICPTRLRIGTMSDGGIAVWDCPERPACDGWRFVTTIHKLLRNKQFDRLDSLAKLLQGDPEPFPWDPEVPKYVTLQNTVLTYPSAMETSVRGNPAPALDEWLAHNPQSPTARLFQAVVLLRRGWEKRGTGFADTVTDEGWKEFHALVRQAHQTIQPLLAEAEPPPEAFATLFEVAKAESWEGTEFRPYLEQFLERHAAYISPHRAVAEKMLPRWGGGPRDAATYADDVARRLGGEAGEMMYARIALYLFRFHDRTEFWDLTGFDYERVQRALEQRLQARPKESYAASEGLVLAHLRKDEPRQAFYRDYLNEHDLAPHATAFFYSTHFEFPLDSPLKGRNN